MLEVYLSDVYTIAEQEHLIHQADFENFPVSFLLPYNPQQYNNIIIMN